MQSRPLITPGAEKFLAAGVNGLGGGSVTPAWLPDDRFWYRTTLVDGTTQTILIDPAKKTRIVCTPAVAECASFAFGRCVRDDWTSRHGGQ